MQTHRRIKVVHGACTNLGICRGATYWEGKGFAIAVHLELEVMVVWCVRKTVLVEVSGMVCGVAPRGLWGLECGSLRPLSVTQAFLPIPST